MAGLNSAVDVRRVGARSGAPDELSASPHLFPPRPPLPVPPLALGARAAPAGTAQAATTCPTAAQLEQPFLSFGDAAQYFLTSMGSFETKPWPGGTVVAGNEPSNVRRGGAADSHSLSFSRPG